MKIKKIDISSIFPIIINKIKLILEDVNRLAKFKFCMLNISEFTVFVKVKIDNLNDFSKPISSITNRLDKIKRLKKKRDKYQKRYFYVVICYLFIRAKYCFINYTIRAYKFDDF